MKVNEVASPSPLDDESDLTDLTEVEESIAAVTPSPRRLRSKGEKPVASGRRSKERSEEDADVEKRVTPMRKAKKNVGSLAEDDDDEEEDQLESDAEQEDDEEEDQLASPLTTPKATRRTPVKRRLRPRRIQTHTPPSDGDDEHSAGEDIDAIPDGVGASDDESIVTDNGSADEDSVEEPVAEPCVLRNGKVVGEGEADEESIGDEDEDDEEDDESQASTVEEVEDEVEGQADTDEAEDEEAEEPMEDDSA